MTHEDRIKQIVAVAYERLCGKITGQRIEISNEASLQLQLASILKTLGELYEESPSERFNIELEKSVKLTDRTFTKSGTEKAKIDIWFSLEDIESGKKHACAIELKYFKRANHREPNNRYDVFKDLQNLECYGDFVDVGYLLVATDHPHYINQEIYSPDTKDFDFRHGNNYQAGNELVYRSDKPYGVPITLGNDYTFDWQTVETGLNFLFVEVIPCK
ncbi:hypothetical protein [Thiomicrorhabdus sp.]|uniref:hypothetical protein n=1 Tax=Thiomicrorhabdus sp. TaxID=2039724 RepID=UPI002AA85367|nr:hypothetical protein [Thiomicrorhabdus sp.]